ncbi:SUN domain-containing protein 2-like [Ictalurus punctatus]|uniref:SUN domain-containing protein 2-like n=1 Tax=Ictalurus punctatus TaxID=7998 RepID=A0A2D0Q557_ICTPU|nr:SUN domain-containing protein 2-like [Ictalurus punctatus]
MFCHSPGLISNGYYHPNQQISYAEHPVRRRNRTVSELSARDYEKLKAKMFRYGPRLISNGYFHPSRQIYVEHPDRRRTVSESTQNYERLEACPILTPEQLIGQHTPPPTEGRPPPMQEAEEPPVLNHFTPSIVTSLMYYLYVFLVLAVLLTMLCSVFHMSEKQYVNHTMIQVIKKQTLSREELEKIIRRALRTNDTGMTDYALESLGSTVIINSETHKPRYCSQFDFSIWCKKYGPETVLQPDIFPGKCWGFKGYKGHLVIALPHPVLITHVTMEHLPKLFSPPRHRKSATKDFAVYGIVNETKTEKLLGKFTYDQNGEPIQTFNIQGSPSEKYGIVSLRILSNWGHPEYTCVYRFRVHSQTRSG